MTSGMRWLRACRAVVAAAIVASCTGQTGGEATQEFEYTSGLDSVRLRYAPGPPARLFDSSILEIALRHEPELATDSLMVEWLPSRSGWSLPIDSFLVRDSDGWYRASVWVCPTEPGELLLRWQTVPFTGFTYYLAARYDSTGALVDWNDEPVATEPERDLYVQDTMEFVFNFWPHVFYRRVQLVREPSRKNTYWIVTQSLYRTAGASARSMWPSANLTFDGQYPLRTRQWQRGGWVADTLLATVRQDTMVATIDWSYQGIGDNWEKNRTLFREWTYERKPQVFFQLDSEGHIAWASKQKPDDRRVAAQLRSVGSEPEFEAAKKAFIATPSAEAPESP